MDLIHDTMDYGYDPTVAEPGPIFVPPRPAIPPPPSANVDATFLPPVGKQTTPSCFVWASTYGLATFAAAKAGGTVHPQPSLQASPAYTYIKVLEANGTSSDTCVGGQMTACFNFLKNNNGTPSVQAAPIPTGCSPVWSAYGTTTLPSDPNFDVTGWAKISVTGAEGLDNVRALIAQGIPLAYGTRLYTDFAKYDGTPSPYVGNGQIAMNPKTGKPVGHCMMIIAYNDNFGAGAVLLQNSFGTSWGATWNGTGGWLCVDGIFDLPDARARPGVLHHVRLIRPFGMTRAGGGVKPPKIRFRSPGGTPRR